jgi:DnaA family protein
MRQLLLDFDRAPAPTFANFVTGANAELTHALESATHGTFTERVIYVWGEAGAGKTHLLKALVNAVKGSRYFAARDLADADMNGTLAVDGVERLPEDRQVALFNAFNERTFDLLVVPRAHPRVKCRSAATSPRAWRPASPYRVVALTDAEKGAALAAHAKTRGFAIPEDVTFLPAHARAPRHGLAHRRARFAGPVFDGDGPADHRSRC